MSLRARIRIGQTLVTIASLVAVAIVLAGSSSLALTVLFSAAGKYLLLAPFIAWACSGWVLRRVLVARASRRLARMVARGETRACEQLIEEIAAAQGGRGAAALALHRAALRCAEGRFHEAWSALDSIDVAGSPMAPYVANLRAWALAFDGHPSRARELLTRAMSDHRGGGRVRAMLRGTYGVACVLDGMASEGRSALEEAIRDGDAQSRATWSYFLGEAMHERGDDERAAQAYEETLEAEERGALAERARERLRRLALGATPYR